MASGEHMRPVVASPSETHPNPPANGGGDGDDDGGGGGDSSAGEGEGDAADKMKAGARRALRRFHARTDGRPDLSNRRTG